jgi:hypothetical protein
MNFILKNLWWVFLFLFFLFMLFIIASNNPEKTSNNDTSTGSIWTQDIQWDSVDLLIERLEEEAQAQEDLWERESTLQDEDISVQDSDVWDTNALEEEVEEKKWFFSRLFSSKNQDTDSQETEWDENVRDESDIDVEVWDWDSETMQDQSEATQVAPVTTVTTEEYRWATQSTHLSKTEIQTRDIYAHIPVHTPTSHPDIEAHWDIWDSYRVNTYSLKLNNRYFSETLWYLMGGDILVQKSSINPYGCFEAEVTESKTALARVWYVCLRHLELLDSSYWVVIQEEELDVRASEEVSLSIYPQTQVWDSITVTAHQYDIDFWALFSWDTLEQLSEINAAGCFIWAVKSVQFAGYNNLIGRSQEFCLRDILR